MKKHLKLLILYALASPALLSTWALASDAGTALKTDSIRAEPFTDAKTVGNINKNDAVDILNKKGAWLQIKSKSGNGWVRILSVKRGTASSSGSSIADVASGRTGTGKVVSTTGIRGLSAEELKAAKFNEAEMKKMESHTLSPVEGESFARTGGLTATKMTYLKGAK